MGANPIVDGVVLPVPAFRTIAEMITGGVLDKHPSLKIISVENDIGWMPNYLKRLEWYSYRFGPRFPQLEGQRRRHLARQVYATFQDDVPGIRCRDLIGVDRLMWGSDYPHFDSTFPKSREAIERNFEGVPEDEQRADPGREHGPRLQPAGRAGAERRRRSSSLSRRSGASRRWGILY